MEELPEDYKLILFNDDRHSFAYVVACLIRFCGHSPDQAEQCALVTDLAGQCTIKHGCWAQIETMKEFLEGAELTVKMEVNE